MTEFLKAFSDVASSFGPKITLGLLIVGGIIYTVHMILKNYSSTIQKYLEERMSSSLKEHSKALVHRKEITPKINKELNLLAEEINADRALLFEFSNGNSNLIGLPFLYHTATSEVIRIGNAPMAQHFQKVNTSILAQLFEHLENKGYFYVSDIEEIKSIYPTLYVLLKPEDIKSLLLYSIYGVDDTIGFVMVASTGENTFTRENTLSKVACTSQIISALLNFNRIQEY